MEAENWLRICSYDLVKAKGLTKVKAVKKKDNESIQKIFKE